MQARADGGAERAGTIVQPYARGRTPPSAGVGHPRPSRRHPRAAPPPPPPHGIPSSCRPTFVCCVASLCYRCCAVCWGSRSRWCSRLRHDRCCALDRWMDAGCCSSIAPPSAISPHPLRSAAAITIGAHLHALLLLLVAMRYHAGARISAAVAGLCDNSGALLVIRSRPGRPLSAFASGWMD